VIPHSRPHIAAADRQAVLELLDGGMVNEGEKAAQLEDWFVRVYGGRDAVAVGSGSQALALALGALALQPGDEVIVPDYVCIEVLAVVESMGLTPLIVDVGDDYLISHDAARAAISQRTGAIILPYTLGIHTDPRPLATLGLPVIEDCATFFPVGHAAAWPLLGHLAVFSFEGTKLVTSGEGGLVLTSDQALAARLRAAKRYRRTGFKLNLYPLSDLQAALALSQLGRIEWLVERRRALALAYVAALEDVEGLLVPRQILDRSVFFRLPLQAAAPRAGAVDALIAAFAQEGIAVRRPVSDLSSALSGRPPSRNAARLHAVTFSLPLYPALSEAEHERVIDVARRVIPRAVMDAVRT
jgi:UDP-4-amino-4-deoxy-L-arabinose-oxoglutarate aminotransferase